MTIFKCSAIFSSNFFKEYKTENLLITITKKKAKVQTSIHIPVKKFSNDFSCDVVLQSEFKQFYKFENSKADRNESQKFSPCHPIILDLS